LYGLDGAGATIEHEGAHVRYRVDAATATTTIDFVRCHRQVVLAMVEDNRGYLEAYRVEERQTDEH
jgi:hypothetical protein